MYNNINKYATNALSLSARRSLEEFAKRNKLDYKFASLFNCRDINVIDGASHGLWHYAAMLNDIKIGEVLIGCFANPNIANKDGATPLHYAVANNHPEFIKLLLIEARADHNLTDNFGYKPLDLAIKLKYHDIADLLQSIIIQPLVCETPVYENFFKILGNGTLSQIQEFIDVTYSPNIYNRNVYAFLNAAILEGKLDFVKLFLDNGVNPNYVFGEFPSLLNIAAASGSIEAVKLLFEYGADPNVTDHFQPSPLNTAALFQHYDIVRLLLEHGTKVNLVDCNGYTALHYTASAGRLETVQTLLEYGADPRVVDIHGLNPLEYMDRDKYPAVALLLKEAIKQQNRIAGQQNGDGGCILY